MPHNELLDNHPQIPENKWAIFLAKAKEEKGKTFLLLLLASIPSIVLLYRGELQGIGHFLILLVSSWFMAYILALGVVLIAVALAVIVGVPLLISFSLLGILDKDKVKKVSNSANQLNLYNYRWLVIAGLVLESLLLFFYFLLIP